LPRRKDWYREYLDDWRAISTEARATVRIARRLQSGQLAERADWEAIRGQDTRMRGFGVLAPVREGPWLDQPLGKKVPQPGGSFALVFEPRIIVPGGTTLEDQRISFWNAMDGWVLRGGVRPFFEWGVQPGAKPSVRLGGYSLYGAIAVQLLFDVSRTDGLAVCTSCGTPYLTPTRRPRWDQHTYCPDCGKKAAARDAAARYRRTEKYRQARLRRVSAARE
jgi:predicted RNA-binding Zn-ribbon protein involved in translation (DUF1610 family)